MKIRILENKNENLSEKYVQLLEKVFDEKKSVDESSMARFDDDQTTSNDKQPKDCCEVCWKVLPADELSRHICVNKQTEIRCDYCEAILKSTIDFYNHLTEASHPNTIFYECEECSTQYPSQILLKFHQKSKSKHEDEDEKCQLCHVKFGRDWHLCDKPNETIQCDYCTESFDATTKLIEHLDSEHVDGILHTCRKCPKSFKMAFLRGEN